MSAIPSGGVPSSSSGRSGAITSAFAISLMGVFALLGVVSLTLPSFSPNSIDVANRFGSISSDHWLGTDYLGRDLFHMLLTAAGNSAVIAFSSVFFGAFIGVSSGLVSARAGGSTGRILERVSDFAFAFPAVISAAIFTTITGPGAVNAVLAIAIFNVPVFSRITRSGARRILSTGYILAAHSAGHTRPYILWMHVLPNLSGILLTQLAMQLSLAMLAETGLSYLGFGIQPPLPSLGKMLFDARSFLYVAPEQIFLPGTIIVIFVMGCNRVGEDLRIRLGEPRRGLETNG